MSEPSPHLRVERTTDAHWRVVDERDEELASATTWLRPDQRSVLAIGGDTDVGLRLLVPAVAQATSHELLVNVRLDNHEMRKQYAALGFREKRTEATYVLRVADATTALRSAALPDGVAAVTISEVSEDALRAVDERLRQDVPGTDGWRWLRKASERKPSGPGSLPTSYLVATDAATEALVGIARVWVHEGRRPRLGFIGTLPSHRRKGIARALLSTIFARLSERGIDYVTTEADVENVASTSLLSSLGAERVGGYVELSLPHRSTDTGGSG